MEVTRVQELRIASDGKAYAVSEFQRWYGNEWEKQWNTAQPLPRVQEAPEGLVTRSLDVVLVEEVLSEILPLFPTKQERADSEGRNAVEIGWTIDHDYLRSHNDYRAVKGYALEDFPSVYELVRSATALLGGDTNNLKERCNVSCLLYSPGHSIGWHCDRPYCYKSVVYGCILFNESDSALEFHDTAGNGCPSKRYIVEETPGTCFAQQGPARYEWRHGVPPLGSGERLSVTWRWFLDDVSLLRCDGEERPTKVLCRLEDRGIASALALGAESAVGGQQSEEGCNDEDATADPWIDEYLSLQKSEVVHVEEGHIEGGWAYGFS